MSDIAIADPSLVMLFGTGALARRAFDADEVVSNEAAAERRLARNLLTVVDATDAGIDADSVVHRARRHHVMPVALAVEPPRIEGFARVHVLAGEDAIASATIVREPLACDLRHLSGPFDVIGDVHGCFDELIELLALLGWTDLPAAGEGPTRAPRHPDGRTLVLLGDVNDRGPRIADCLELAMLAREAGALWLMGNHEAKLLKTLRGGEVKVTHGLENTLRDLQSRDDAFTARVRSVLESLHEHHVLDGGRLVVAHAGMKERLQGRWGKVVRAFGLYGETTGESDEYGLPVRYPWAKDYRGSATVLYGHTPTPRPEWVNGTLCVDTGCVFGGSLSALRWPERELVQVRAHRTWYASARPYEWS